MFVGGCAGSTTGGIKIFRLQILFRGAITQIRKLTQPHAVLVMRFNGKTVNENTYNSIMGFFFMYIFLFILSAVSLSLFNLDFLTAFSAAASAISNVGPGLGVDPNTPAVGGHQQLFRVNPINVGAYKLTTLPGRSGPAFDLKGGRRGIVGELGHNKPETTSFLLDRRPPTGGRAQGFSGVVPRGEHEKTKRTTNRSETGLRTDTLSTAAPKRAVSALTRAAEPTRNKKDGNIEAYQYNNMPAPNINKYTHGYLNSPAIKIGESRVYGDSHTADELMKFGFRPTADRRGKAGRPAGAGRMNVRADPLNQSGMLTGVRSDTSRIDGRVNAANGGWTQQYRNADYHQFNAYKGNINPNATQDALDLPKRQLSNNPLAHSLS